MMHARLRELLPLEGGLVSEFSRRSPWARAFSISFGKTKEIS
jgi:hypothetical protein